MYTRDFGRLRIADLEGGIDERLQKPNKISAQKNLQLGMWKFRQKPAWQTPDLQVFCFTFASLGTFSAAELQKHAHNNHLGEKTRGNFPGKS